MAMNNWDDLRYYLAVARSGTVSAAARELGVSHTTVLRHIDQLEVEAGVKLFKRLQRGYQLSEAGEKLLQEANHLESDIQSMMARVKGQDDNLAGSLRVTQPQAGAFDIYSIYARFIHQYPEISLEIQHRYWELNLNKHEADVAIIHSEQPAELLVGRCVGMVHYRPYASANYLARFDQIPQLSDIEWIVMDQHVTNQTQGDTESLWDQLCRLVPNPKVVMQTSSYADILFAAREGLGAAFMSHVFAKKYQDLLPVPGCDISNTRDVWVLTHRDLRNIARVKCFMRFVSDELMKQLAAD
jgi:molybdate transport repressor ModE-like protein